MEAGDTVSATLQKEFGEEALNILELPEDEKREAERQINELFKHGTEVEYLTICRTLLVPS